MPFVRLSQRNNFFF